MQLRSLGCGALAIFMAACTTTNSKNAGTDQVVADARTLVIASYQCQDALGREPHYSAIESSETVLKALGKSADQADQTVRGWLREVNAGPKQPGDFDAKTCKDRLLTLAEKVRVGYEAIKRKGN